MKRIFSICLISLTALILLSCHGGKNKGTMSFSLEGQLENASGKTIYIEEMTPDNGPQFLDSIVCDKNGHFKYKGSMNYQTFFNLHTSEYDYIVLLPQDDEKIQLTGDASNLSVNYHVEGSPESQLMWQIMSYVNDANLAITDIVARDRKNRETLNETEYQKAHDVTDSMFIAERTSVYLMFYNFIEDNLGSLSTLYAIDAPFNHSMRVFYAEGDFEVFEMVLEGLEQENPNNPHTQYYRTRVERARSARLMSQQQ